MRKTTKIFYSPRNAERRPAKTPPPPTPPPAPNVTTRPTPNPPPSLPSKHVEGDTIPPLLQLLYFDAHYSTNIMHFPTIDIMMLGAARPTLPMDPDS